MSSPRAAEFAYLDDTFQKECPKCGKMNEVSVPKQDGHNEPEEYFCASCGHELGKVRASNTPKTKII